MGRIRWFTRTSRIVALCAAANFINSADRVIMPIAILPMADLFEWSLHDQGYILSAFAFGYFTSQIIGSLFLACLRVKSMLIGSVLLWSAATFMTPLLTPSFGAVVLGRIVLGFAEGLSLPTIFHLFAHSIPVEGRSRAFGYLLAAGGVGQTVASIVCPHLHWASSFYFFGALGFLWIGAWLACYPERPLGNVEETLPLAGDATATATVAAEPLSVWPSWQLMYTLVSKRALWALYVAHFAMNWASYIVMQWLPTYLTRTLAADALCLSLTAVPYVVNSVCGVVSGHLADSLLTHKSWSVLNVRRLMTCIGLVGPALFLAIFCVTRDRLLAILLVSVSMGLSAANSAGHLSNHVDVAPNHSGTTFAISNTLATIPGILCGPVIAHMVTASATNGWLIVFLFSTAINLYAAKFYFVNSTATKVV